MPAAAPKTSAKAIEQLKDVGRIIRTHRKALGITATATSEAAGISRVTLHRIEKGVPSVTIGAYFNVLTALNLTYSIDEFNNKTITESNDKTKGWIPAKIAFADYPQLKQIAWHVQGVDEISPIEALGIYERNSRFIEQDKLSNSERDLIESLHLVLGGLKR